MSSAPIPTAERGTRPEAVTIDRCRGCGGEGLEHILDFGAHPLANGLLSRPDEVAKRYPLRLAFCPGCSLLQILETVDKRILFSDYLWVTGTSSSARRFAVQFCENVRRLVPLDRADLVLEIASNDGTFLAPFIAAGARALGIDPAANITSLSVARGIPTLTAFWDCDVARRIVAEHGPARVIFARNVVPHVSELAAVIEGIRVALADDGIGAIEFHYAGKILEELQYDAIYHEHLCYFSLGSIEHVLRRRELHVFHVDTSPISGGACIVYFSREPRKPTEAYAAFAQEEARARVNDLAAWRSFAEACARHREMSRAALRGFAGRKVIGYGASARSSTYLNFCEFGGADIAAVIDNNPLKHGRYTAGSRIPIVPAAAGLAMLPDAIFVLAWNFKEEIAALCREAGYEGPFLIPFPRAPYVVEKGGST